MNVDTSAAAVERLVSAHDPSNARLRTPEYDAFLGHLTAATLRALLAERDGYAEHLRMSREATANAQRACKTAEEQVWAALAERDAARARADSSDYGEESSERRALCAEVERVGARGRAARDADGCCVGGGAMTLREVVAIEIDHDAVLGLACVRPAERKARALEKADAILAALRDAGFAVVPREPTREMAEAAKQRPSAGEPPEGGAFGFYGGIYRAMLAAAEETQS